MLISIKKLMACIAMAFTACNAMALAVEDCDRSLTKDYYVDSTKRSLQVDYLKTIDQKTWRDLKSEASINLIVDEVPIGASYSEFDKTRTAYLEKQKYRRSEYEASSIVKAVTSDRAYSAYEACLRAADIGQGLRVWASKETMDIIELRVLYRNPPSKPSINLLGQIDGGSVVGVPVGALWTEDKKAWGVNEERAIRIRRQPGTSETSVIVSSDDGAPPVSLTFTRADAVARLRFQGTVDVLRERGLAGRVVTTPNNDHNTSANCPNFVGRENGRFCTSRTKAVISTTAPFFLVNLDSHVIGDFSRKQPIIKNSETEYEGYVDNWGPSISFYLTADLYEHLSPSSCGSQSEIPMINGKSTVFTVPKECLPMVHIEWKKLSSGDQGSFAFSTEGDQTFRRNGTAVESAGVVSVSYRFGDMDKK